MAYVYEYPRPTLTVDCVIFGLDESSRLKALLIQRPKEPFKGHWALPGGFVDENETIEAAALRELKRETGVENIFIEQLYTFGTPGRDPRGRVVTIAYFALINLTEHQLGDDTDAQDVRWFEINDLPALAFDHQEIINLAIERLRGKVRYQPIGFELLPQKFTLSQLQSLYEKIIGKTLNKRNFRTKFLKMNILRELDIQRGMAHRPAQLYAFDEEKYKTYLTQGFNFEIKPPSNKVKKTKMLV